MRWWRSFSGRAQREVLLRGSPAYKWGVWIAGLGGGLLWIWESEKNAPISERRVFLPAKREVRMTEEEIRKWNEKYSGGAALLPPPHPHASFARDVASGRHGLGRRSERTGGSWPGDTGDARRECNSEFDRDKRGDERGGARGEPRFCVASEAPDESVLFSSLHRPLRKQEAEMRSRDWRREEALRRRREREAEDERRGPRVSVDEAREKLREQLKKETGQDGGDGRRARRQPFFSSLR
uniref:Uncharacterized protein n=1 Tax=Neospora caninum (strain Liverpool) TaxID=572307 RepID=A0A0F7U7I2_NEOCL|nr:TPA: hypothetical protein BN1204_016525 [Neospora caninum Liverpool]